MAVSKAPAEITLRSPEPDDMQELARICFEAFGGIQDHHRFTRDFPSVEFAEQIIGNWISHPNIWGVLAERDGHLLGSNFLDERDPIRGLGPISVDPEGQNAGVGRRLMQAAIERREGAPGIRLLQDAFHMRSLCLYQSLGFDVKEPVAVMTGKPRSGPVDGVDVRPVKEDDLDECETLCKKVHGFERTNELRDATHAFAPVVAERDGRIVAYATTVSFWPMGHGVAETEEDMKALLLGGAAIGDDALAFLVPLRSGMFPWGLSEGLRLVKPMNIMTMGEYQEPQGGWFPNVLY